MNPKFAFQSFMLIIVTILTCPIDDCQNIAASKDSRDKNNSTDSIFFLPFNSNFADQLIHEKKHSNNDDNIPFP